MEVDLPSREDQKRTVHSFVREKLQKEIPKRLIESNLEFDISFILHSSFLLFLYLFSYELSPDDHVDCLSNRIVFSVGLAS